jgi:hypothetical protein
MTTAVGKSASSAIKRLVERLSLENMLFGSVDGALKRDSRKYPRRDHDGQMDKADERQIVAVRARAINRRFGKN